jgi:type IV pili sensor histidine kinase/response regulator
MLFTAIETPPPIVWWPFSSIGRKAGVMQSVKFNQWRLVATILFTVASTATQAGIPDHRVSESRYLSVQVGPERNQIDLLQSIIDLSIPERLKTVGEALTYLLTPYGYQIEVDFDITEQSLLFMLALPGPHRQLGPITLMDALTTLGGASFQSVINPVKRTVRYQLREGFEQFVTDEELDYARKQWLAKQERVSLATIKESLTFPALQEHRRYVLVKQGDSLSRIASQLDLGGITTDQSLAYLFHANPHAFMNSNMNYLLAGVTLRLPPVDRETLLSATDASLLADKHDRLWVQHKVQP